MHNILWIDDEHQKLGGLKVIAKSKYGLLIHGVDNYKDGINWLKNHSTTCRAVVLDIECKETRNTSVAIEAFDDWSEITRLCAKYNDIPWFVYTGLEEEDIPSDIRGALNFAARGRNEKPFYIKSVDNVWEKVYEHIENTLVGQLEKKYSEILGFIGNSEREKLLRVMISIAEGDTRNTSCMNDMRQVLEWLTIYLANYGFLPRGSELSDMRHYMVLLNDVGLDEIIPKYIRYTVQACENATQEGSHNGIKDGIQVTKAIGMGRAPYLIESTLNNVLTILHWAMLLPTEEKEKNEILKSIKPHVAREEGGLQYNQDYNFYYVNDCKINYNSYRGDLSEAVGRRTIVYKKVLNKKNNNYNDEPKYFTKNFEITNDVFM